MKRYRAIILFAGLLLLSPGMLLSAADAGVIDPQLEQSLASLGPQEELPVIIKAKGKAELHLIRDKDKGLRRSKIIKELKDTADVSQRDIHAFLKKRGIGKLRSLWIINGLALRASADVVRELATLPQVESITLDAVIHAPVTTFGVQAAPEWNINAIHAPDLWNLGHTGQGVVVANMDTGVDPDHPDLSARWRDGANSWYSPYSLPANAAFCKTPGQCAACELSTAPCDVDGHGTGTMGIMVGGDAGGTFIGVAPGAQWIAVKIFNDAGDAAHSVIHQGFQWLLDPDGNPDTDDAPDVVNNSWGLDNVNNCSPEFQADIQALKAASMAVVFSAGNSGNLGSSTSVSPANNPEGFAVGAVDNNSIIADFSSRGPSACDGGIYPELVAPGVNVRTSDLYFGIPDPSMYANVSGTSFAAPHVAGAMALLINVFPSLDASVIETALMNTAADLGASGPDNDYGHGLINVLSAYNILHKIDTIGVFRAGQWYLDINGTMAWDTGTDTIQDFGISGDIPVTGDWNGTGTTSIGVFRNGQWYLDLNGNRTWDTGTDTIHDFGIPGDIPVTGDWDRSGITKIGVFRNGQWYLDLNGNRTWDTGTDGIFNFGIPGDVPVTGDWDGAGITKIGVFRNGQWYLDTNGNGVFDFGIDTITDFGIPGDIPVTGNWTGTGTTKIGVFRNGEWYLDLDGNRTWDTGTDTIHNFGISGDIPVAGKW